MRACHGLEEYARCVELQRIIWGEDITIPAPMFVVAAETGGQVLGAFEGGQMIGFILALAGIHQNHVFLHSHMAAVLPEHQNRGIGRTLKLAQREEALARGINLVEWTFDPLELRNAHFNLMRLGAVARRLIPNCYGITDSPLHAGLPTDRLVVEWWLQSKRTSNIIANKAPRASAEAVRISVPADIGDWKYKDRERALRVQSEIRQQFEQLFSRGYVAAALERAENLSHYILEPPGSPAARVEE